MPMEKKILSVTIRMSETLLQDLRGVAEARGMSESSFVRLAISEVIENERKYHASLSRIFLPDCPEIKRSLARTCTTRCDDEEDDV